MSNPRSSQGVLGGARRFLADLRGAAAAEFVLWVAILTVPVLSAVDIGVYAFQRMQLEIAAQAAVQTAWHVCNKTTLLPAVKNCAGLSAAMTSAAQGTSLGTTVTITTTPVSEGYYCVNASNKLVLVGTTATFGATPAAPAPFDCHTVIALSTAKPGDYIQVTASYAYAPVFPGVSVASLLTTPITRTAKMRLN